MVRAHSKQTPDPEKNDTQKKKTTTTTTKKKAAEPGSWPCKINGCNKVFAREADLKRHQRTTKTHTMPGFACPQCDATFTRTDALRRHQKSRHNGVIIEPQETPNKNVEPDDNAEPSGSRSSSRSGTPAGSNADPESANNSPEATVNQQSQYPLGPSSYYRPHTMHTSPYPPRPGPMDVHYPPPIGIPTSATRMHQPSWQPPAAWPDGTPVPHPGMYPPPPPGYYQPSPYYRPPPMYPLPANYPQVHPDFMNQPYPYHVPPGPPMHFPPQSGGVQPPLSAIPRGGSAGPAKGADANSNADSSNVGAKVRPSKKRKRGNTSSTVPVNAAAVEQAMHASGGDYGPAVNGVETASDTSLTMDADEAATVVALLQQASGHSPTSPDNSSSQSMSQMPEPPGEISTTRATIADPQPPGQQEIPGPAALELVDDVDADGDADADGEADAEADIEVPDPSPTKLQEPAISIQPQLASSDQMLTEDGEPMLNPAELLTQESLASPPQS